jgi:hypothetical protein
MELNKNSDINYFFVDESGDPTFYNKEGKYIVGGEGCSKILILGFVMTSNPKILRQSIINLMEEISKDEYLKNIPSLKRTLAEGFHAKNDTPEIREKFFKLIKTLDFKAELFVARKIENLFLKRHQGKEGLFYDDMIIKLFENKLHLKPTNYLYFAVRGNKKRQAPLNNAIITARNVFEKKYNKKIDSEYTVIPQTPTGEPCLQITDYINWAVYRAFTRGEERYINYIIEKISLIVDIYDFGKYPKNYYNRNNKFSIKKISPLQLG